MKHPHFDLIVQWANDPSIQIQYKVGSMWFDSESPTWNNGNEYRIKPHKHQELIDAYNKGEKIQFWSEFHQEWMGTKPLWDENTKYRIKPKTITKTYNIQYQVINDWSELLNGQVENLKLTFEDTGERIAKLVKAEVIE